LLSTVDDPSLSISVKSEIVYETSVELVNELLSEPELLAKSPRLENVSRATTMLVLNDPSAFSHLFAASHHDFYTATHMVNVATWMVPLAHAMGHRDTNELNTICQAGILHDVGKIYIPTETLNRKGKLSDAEFHAGRLSTAFLDEFFARRQAPEPALEAEAIAALAATLAQRKPDNAPSTAPTSQWLQTGRESLLR
jgi:HD-GYP domain-containing protein (c-di-GMP phosphodiesterase class II)